MEKGDRDLGMNRAITRRDFIDGVGVAIGGALVLPKTLQARSPQAHPQAVGTAATGETAANYPPLRLGMRGAHPGSFETAHAVRQSNPWTAPEDTREMYDLVVVGGGLSGLAAAYYFTKINGRDARVLVLDNHDDFGGHAKRNEFEHGGRVIVATGGTEYLVSPSTFPAQAWDMLRDIGVDVHDPSCRLDRNLYRSLGLGPGVFFDKETYGVDRLVTGGSTSAPTAEFLAKTPLSPQVRADFLRLFEDTRDPLPALSRDEKIRKLQSISYRDYLLDVMKVHPDVLQLAGGVWCVSQDCASAWFAYYRYKPGFVGIGVARPPDSPEDPKMAAEDFYFPGGNHDVARLIVRWLIPDALPAKSMADAQARRVDYAKLDQPGSKARIRLNSIAVRVRHVGERSTTQFEPETRDVEVVYVRGDKAYQVRAKGVVLACNNAMIPYLCPEMPDTQKQALHLSVRSVNLATNVLVRNWQAFEKLRVARVNCPGSFYASMGLYTAVSLGGYEAPRTPDEPIVVRLGGSSGILAHGPIVRALRGKPFTPGTPLRDQYRQLRQTLLETPFETFERAIRDQLGRVLSAGGFDPARDIEGIAVNRWPHGFAMCEDALFDAGSAEDERPCVVGRKKFGRITIANSDASGIDLTQTAFDQAYRAVDELQPRRFGYFSRI